MIFVSLSMQEKSIGKFHSFDFSIDCGTFLKMIDAKIISVTAHSNQ